jgi:hypothetical protein
MLSENDLSNSAFGYQQYEVVEPVTVTLTEPAHDDIARLAYALWQSRGETDGSPDEDWFNAERLLIAESSR